MRIKEVLSKATATTRYPPLIVCHNLVNAPEAASVAIAAVGSANAEAPTQTSTATDVLTEGDDVPRELKDLRRRLNYLKNIYDIKDSVGSRTNDKLYKSISCTYLLDRKLYTIQ